MEYTFHLGFVAYQTNENDPIPEESAQQLVPVQAPPAMQQGSTPNAEVPKVYTKLLKIIEFDTFVATHGPGTDVDGMLKRFIIIIAFLQTYLFLDTPPHKRKLGNEHGAPSAKQAKTIYPAYFIPELAHVVAMCDEKIPFLNLAQALTKHNIPHSGLQVESNATSLVLKILTLPQPGQQQPEEQKASLLITLVNSW